MYKTILDPVSGEPVEDVAGVREQSSGPEVLDGSSGRKVKEKTPDRGSNVGTECSQKLPGWFITLLLTLVHSEYHPCGSLFIIKTLFL